MYQFYVYIRPLKSVYCMYIAVCVWSVGMGERGGACSYNYTHIHAHILATVHFVICLKQCV